MLPLVRLVWLAVQDGLGANPVEFILRSLGTWTLVTLLVTLSITPIRMLTGQAWPVQLRRMLGLWTFFYATLHLLAYVGLDQWFDWRAVMHDIEKHPYVLAGLSAYLLMLPLALTSTRRAMRKLGPHWQRLHRAVYAVAVLGVLHYWWLVKKDVTEPLVYAVVLTVLLAIRLHRHPAFARAGKLAVQK